MPALVHYNVQGAAARIVLDSPHNKNALSTALVHQLQQGLSDAAEESGVRAVVLTHTGSTFCAGADLSQATSGEPADPADVAVHRAHEMTHLLRAILELPIPVIAAVDGHVRAGGLGLIGACDMVVAGPASTFALTEARIGVAPSIISLTLLPKMTPRAAGRYFVTGEKFDSHQAASIGLVTQAADSAESMTAAVEALIANIAKASPQGLAASKALTTASILKDFDRHAEKLAKQSAALFVSDEAREGMLAFLQKRPPTWTQS
ncbi:enoyl-CoA hydratase family protein [Mycolicibacterium sp. P9-64]|uniref:enoyl-CoA hydratase family protein n=1 Tax=Mycolicibacterium sp. P9-64 TaxID=2024612 RepID=UPI0011F06B38|nr:enoyl-CoA hydratase family protein [Mycolicibacterium sp. P9-64]KAA0082773.1 enoyl-CoA hydratase family protein [Mycolicibacterium sp. P9-64]